MKSNNKNIKWVIIAAVAVIAFGIVGIIVGLLAKIGINILEDNKSDYTEDLYYDLLETYDSYEGIIQDYISEKYSSFKGKVSDYPIKPQKNRLYEEDEDTLDWIEEMMSPSDWYSEHYRVTYNEKAYAEYCVLDEYYIDKLSEADNLESSIICYNEETGEHDTVSYGELADEDRYNIYTFNGISEDLYIVIKNVKLNQYVIYEREGVAFDIEPVAEWVNAPDMEEKVKTAEIFLDSIGFADYIWLETSRIDVTLKNEGKNEITETVLSYYPEDEEFLGNLIDLIKSSESYDYKCSKYNTKTDHSVVMNFYHKLLGRYIIISFDKDGDLIIQIDGSYHEYVYDVEESVSGKIIDFLFTNYEGEKTYMESYRTKDYNYTAIEKINNPTDYKYDAVVQEYLQEKYADYAEERYKLNETEEPLYNTDDDVIVDGFKGSKYAMYHKKTQYEGMIYQCYGILKSTDNIEELLGEGVSWSDETGAADDKAIEIYKLKGVSDKAFVVGKLQNVDKYALYGAIYASKDKDGELYPKDVSELCKMLGLDECDDLEFYAELNILYEEDSHFLVDIKSYYYFYDCMELIKLMSDEGKAEFVGKTTNTLTDETFSLNIYHPVLELNIKFEYFEGINNRGNLRVEFYDKEESAYEDAFLYAYEFDTEADDVHKAIDHMLEKYIPIKVLQN